ncbi:chemotaxis protein CheA [Bermanella marisrubri]|uniref:Chemotaxis protein CheA n=1 Tax=Bermanella marisrubri TaxID=207949 RepID=Q1N2U2_9GAMM|nr:chemotaxis protein CheA [Bermanella marisrubri]EAT12577.1 probable two-component sensor [Oceanobacter sp. RED65] [Bermanella marisrubri]QIZ84867.1 chemotaxis protein CheA [Bermanella marisrubri]
MSLDADEEILQDFLVEAGEILELLSEQLVDLENRPDDQDLLNSIFRGFHTVKGGAGFLQINPLVDLCHVAENVFDILRNGQRQVDADLMDVVLSALDSVNDMFETVRGGEMPEPADQSLIDDLKIFSQPAGAAPAPKAEAAPTPPTSAPDTSNEATSSGDSGDITDDEFEGLLDALDGNDAAPAKDDKTTSSDDDLFDVGSTPAASDEDEITEDEFEALLDQLHGSGNGPSKTDDVGSSSEQAETAAPAAPAADGNEEITESEFEELLDKLHGKGKGPSETGAESQVTSEPEPQAQKPDAEPAKAEAPKQEAPAPVAKAERPAAKKPEKKQESPSAEATVRVDTKRLDEIMNMVGELVLVRNRLVRLGLNSNDEAMSKAVSNLDVVTGDLQTSVMKTRMQPIKKVFGRFPRVVRDLARNLKKEVTLELRGEETDLDKNLVEALADPLVHLVRNAVDHGVEMPDEREASGKSRNGTVILSAEQEGDHILLSIQDDGKGMDPKKLQSIAVEKGVMDQDAADRLSDSESYNLIFAPGFSTKTEISDISGRGVGMDVVKTKITQLNGTINIDSQLGKGSKIVIKVPLTLAIMPTLMVMLEDQAFSFPLVSVSEIFHLDLTKTNVVDGQEVVVVREKAIPLFYLKRWVIPNSHNVEVTEGHVVVINVGSQRVGFVVDQLVGQEEVVIKPLGKMLQGTPGMAGATITGDGRIALILDVPSMLQHYAKRSGVVAA